MSGGQRQRVALARCLVTEPSLVLLDEPLANLDVHLRAAMEREFARFHERTGTTMIYITHDQTEAMALADRIAVMDKGRVLQFATPSQLYREPADATVAKFIGEGMVVPVQSRRGRTATRRCDVDLFGHRVRMRCAARQRPRAASRLPARVARCAIVAPGDDRVARAGDRHRSTRAGIFASTRTSRGGRDVPLHLSLAEPSAVAPGADIDLAVDDGWVIPGRARRADACASTSTAASAKKDAPASASRAAAIACCSTPA